VRNVITPGCEWISRDNVRFAFLKPGEDYFSHEDEVFDTFINYINQTLEKEDIHTIYIDATHLNKKSRDKTLRRVYKKNIEELNCLCFTTPKEVCHARNNLREGRSKVPATVVDNMFRAYSLPTKDEGFTHIYDVDQDGNIKEIY
jgi:predicted kinase